MRTRAGSSLAGPTDSIVAGAVRLSSIPPAEPKRRFAAGEPRRRFVMAASSAAVIATLFPRPSLALDWSLGIENRAFSQSLPEDVLFAQFRFPESAAATSTRTAYQLHVLGRVAGRPMDAIGLELGFDTGLIEIGREGLSVDGRSFREQAEETLFLGATFADLQLGDTGVVEIQLGKLRPRIGGGSIFAAYAFGLSADADLSLVERESPWRFRAYALLPDATFTAQSKTSPLFEIEAGYAFGETSEIRIVAASFLDDEDGLEPVLADAVFRGRAIEAEEALERVRDQLPPRLRTAFGSRLNEITARYNAGELGYDVDTSGGIGWIGLMGRLHEDALLLRASAFVGLGRVDTVIVPDAGLVRYVEETFQNALAREAASRLLLAQGPASVDLLSYFASIDGRYDFSRHVSVDGFAILISGDRGFSRSDEATYHSFVALAPLLTYTSIFFNGGVASNLASPAVVSTAPDGAGLLGGGLGLELLPLDALRGRLLAAAFASTVDSGASSSRVYGFEGNVEIDFFISDFLALLASGGVFVPGGYFGDVPPGFQVILSAALDLEGSAQL